MQVPTIRKLGSLPWSWVFQMMIRSVRARLGRSLITASGIFLGIAFLAYVLTRAAVSGASTDSHYLWLALVSLLLATVGIVNSQAMAVTERYREIGTFKCLGALDSLVMRLFLLESGAMGLIAAAVGVLIGCGVGYLTRGAQHLGPIVIQGIPIWLAMITIVLLGGFLSVIAATGPAWRAAKMPAVAAMRTEV